MFAMNVYRCDGVPEATILLQDRGGVDVNVLLLAAFMGAERARSFGPGDVRAAHDRVAQWQRAVVIPLRTIRRQLKNGPAPAPNATTTALRDKIKQIELDAEMIELAELAELVALLEGPAAEGDAAERASAAMTVVARTTSCREPSAEERAAIDVVARAAAGHRAA
jgi:uncharacterized protein (TIGR02444 family)